LYEKALWEYRKALDAAQFLDETHPARPIAYTGTAQVYFIRGDYAEAIRLNQLALEYRMKASPPDIAEIGTSYNNLGEAYLANREFGKAKPALLEAVRCWQGSGWELYPYGNLGLLYYFTGRLDSAEWYMQQALQLQQTVLGAYNPEVARSYNNLSDLACRQGAVDQALEYTQKALIANNFDADRLECISGDVALQTLARTGKFWREKYKHTGNANFLQESARFYEQGLNLLQNLRKTLSIDESTAAFQQEKRAFFEGGLLTFRLLAERSDPGFWSAQMFDFIEQSKSLQLLSGFKRSGFNSSNPNTLALLKEEESLKSQLRALEGQYQYCLSASGKPEAPECLALKAAIAKLFTRVEALQETAKAQVPEYYNLQYNLTTLSLSTLQQNLADNQTFLSYFWGDSVLVLFGVKKNETARYLFIPLDKPLEDWIAAFQEGLYGYQTTPEAARTQAYGDDCLKKLILRGTDLYQVLFAPFQSWLQERVIISPDRSLGYLPFGALLESFPADPSLFSTYPFLVDKHVFSYCPSATLWLEMRAKQHRSTSSEQGLALAPFYSVNDDGRCPAVRYSLDPLPCSGAEVEAVRESCRNTIVQKGNQVDLKTFLQSCSNYSLIHIASHGEVAERSENTRLYFSKTEALYLSEVYLLNLNADLVVLSACEMGAGRIDESEGIVSLSRAFASAGAKSVIATHWKISDGQGTAIFKTFYKNICQSVQNQPKDVALTLALRQYRKTHSSDFGHPFFWAGIFLSGDDSALR
jgi:CHAT domain-containing protein